MIDELIIIYTTVGHLWLQGPIHVESSQ